jgi:hypothetical protein
VAPLDAPAAAPTAPYADPKAHRHRPHLGKVDLELLGRALELHVPAAVRAAPRKRRLDLPVERADRRRAVPVAAVTLAATTLRLGGLVARLALRERSGLALAGPARVREQPLQLGDAGVALGQTLGQLLHGTAELADLGYLLLVRIGFSPVGGVGSEI